MKKTACIAGIFVLSFIGSLSLSFASDKEIAKLYELYNSTSTTERQKHIFRQFINGEERVKQLDNSRRSARKRNSVAPLAAKASGNSSAAPLAADTAFKLGEVYCYPNPAKKTNPTFHVETGLADKVELSIYDVSGDLVREIVLAGPPQLIDDGQGPQLAYEYLWDAGNAGSGVYIFSVTTKQGNRSLRKTGRCAVIK